MQKLGSALVRVQLVSVLRTVELDNEPRFQAKEICEKWSDWILPAELESQELAATQARPQPLFGVSLLASQSASGIASKRWFRRHCFALQICGAPDNRAAQWSLTLSLSRRTGEGIRVVPHLHSRPNMARKLGRKNSPWPSTEKSAPSPAPGNISRHKQTGGPALGRPSKTHRGARASYLPRTRVRDFTGSSCDTEKSCPILNDMSKRRVGACVYCGKSRRLTDDHIPPQGLCDKPRPPDLIKVPSCSSCNNGASRDDEYFKTVMVFKDEAGSHPEAVGIRSSVFRGLQMPEKRGFARDLVQGIREVRAKTPAGLHLGRRFAFDVDLSRLDRVVARITRGLYWHHRRIRIPDGFEVVVFSEDGLRDLDTTERERIRREIVTPVLKNPCHSIGRGVMRYWYASISQQPHALAWLYEFYDDVKFLALVSAHRTAE